MKTKQVTITITEDQQNKAKDHSKRLFGKSNLSGFIGYLIERFDKKGE